MVDQPRVNRMALWNLLAQDFGHHKFLDIRDICDQKIVEGTELDYKQVIPETCLNTLLQCRTGMVG